MLFPCFGRPELVSLLAGIHPPHHRRRSHAGAAVTPVRRLSGGGGEAPGRKQQRQEQGKITKNHLRGTGDFESHSEVKRIQWKAFCQSFSREGTVCSARTYAVSLTNRATSDI